MNSDQNSYDDALKEYEEALAIRRKLAEANPDTYLPDVAMTLVNLSIYFRHAVAQREQSLEYVVEAVIILRPIVDRVPFTQRYLKNAMLVFENWELSNEEIEQMIMEKQR